MIICDLFQMNLGKQRTLKCFSDSVIKPPQRGLFSDTELFLENPIFFRTKVVADQYVQPYEWWCTSGRPWLAKATLE